MSNQINYIDLSIHLAITEAEIQQGIPDVHFRCGQCAPAQSTELKSSKNGKNKQIHVVLEPEKKFDYHQQ